MPTLRSLPLALLGLALTACAGSGGPTAGGTCPDRVAAFKAAFAGLPQVVHDTPGLEIHLDPWGPGREANLAEPPTRPIDLPRATTGQPVQFGHVLVLRADGTVLDDTGDPSDPASVVSHLGMRLGRGFDEPPPEAADPVLLAVEATTPLRALTPLLALLADPRTSEAGVQIPPVAPTVQLLTVPPDYRPPAESDLPAWMKPRVEAMRTQLQTSMRDRIRDPLTVDITCAAVTTELEAADALPGGQRFLAAVRRLPDAIAACNCDGVDIENLAAWLWIRHEPWHPPTRGHAWSLGDASAEVVQLAPTATAADLVPLIDAHAGKPFRVALAPG